MKLTIQAFSSSGGSYPVNFTDESGVLQVFCHCQAGQNQMLCKHKLALLRGETKMLFNPADAPLLEQVSKSPAYPEVRGKLEKFEAELVLIERDMAQLKLKEKLLKQKFNYELTFGRPPKEESKGKAKDYVLRPTATA